MSHAVGLRNTCGEPGLGGSRGLPGLFTSNFCGSLFDILLKIIYAIRKRREIDRHGQQVRHRDYREIRGRIRRVSAGDVFLPILHLIAIRVYVVRRTIRRQIMITQPHPRISNQKSSIPLFQETTWRSGRKRVKRQRKRRWRTGRLNAEKPRRRRQRHRQNLRDYSHLSPEPTSGPWEQAMWSAPLR
jgi:hypothetical protein